MNKSQSVKALGQSIWYDNIERQMLHDGRMQQMIAKGQIYGITSNPSIFEAALKNSTAYDDVLTSMAWAGKNRDQIYFELVKADIQAAADLFLPLYLQSNGQDGYVSVEIDPFLAYDAKRSIEEGRSLWQKIDRENLMIKVPATEAGLEVITSLISEGINVNATLIFSIERYHQVIDSYLAGLEKRLNCSEPIDRIASVASFFVSRIDTAVDQLLGAVSSSPTSLATKAANTKGKIAVANAKLAYQVYLEMFASDRFELLKQHGAREQRPLWASTGTKDPAYSDTLYVDNLIAYHSVNTLPPKTLAAFLNHGHVSLSIEEDLEEAKDDLQFLNQIKIDLAAVTQRLEDEGVGKFKQAHEALLEIIETKRQKNIEDLNGLARPLQTALEKAIDESAVDRIYAHDPTYWTDNEEGFDEIRNRLGWLGLPSQQLVLVEELEVFRDHLLADGFTDAFVLGMGGSSLAPEVISEAIAPTVERGHGLRLQIIDTTNPEEIAFRIKGIDLTKTLFIVSSKSGGTSETLSAMEYFRAELQKLGLTKPGNNFVAITDPGTSLQQLADDRGFRKVFNARPDVGGRFSVFTHFGLVPAAVMGVDLRRFLGQAIEAELRGSQDLPYEANPNLVLGLLLGEGAKTGKDKLTFIAEGHAANLVPWLEQLIAESSGKEGKGILPVEGEPKRSPLEYATDRLFVYLSVDGRQADFVRTLQDEGHPVIEITIQEPYQLAKEFYRWEYATAVACALLRVNAFDQPNVQLSKTITKEVIRQFQEKGRLDDGDLVWENEEAAIYGETVPGLESAGTLTEALIAYAKTVPDHGYIALNAFVPRLGAQETYFQQLRSDLLNNFNKATTLGYGPRFLHSTGQLHKGGQEGGLFFTFTQDNATDFDIPGEGISFGMLQRAQALGDIEALKQKGKKVVRVHLK